MELLLVLTLLALGHASTVFHYPYTNTDTSRQYNSQDQSGSYHFGYDEDHSSGGTFRKESGDAWGNKFGSYGLRDADGRYRVVNYVADANGFRVDINSNEPGVAPADPAYTTINRFGDVMEHRSDGKTNHVSKTNKNSGVKGKPFVPDPISQVPIIQEPINQEFIPQEPISQEFVPQEPINQEPIEQEPISQEPIPQEPINPDTSSRKTPNAFRQDTLAKPSFYGSAIHHAASPEYPLLYAPAPYIHHAASPQFPLLYQPHYIPSYGNYKGSPYRSMPYYTPRQSYKGTPFRHPYGYYRYP